MEAPLLHPVVYSFRYILLRISKIMVSELVSFIAIIVQNRFHWTRYAGRSAKGERNKEHIIRKQPHAKCAMHFLALHAPAETSEP